MSFLCQQGNEQLRNVMGSLYNVLFWDWLISNHIDQGNNDYGWKNNFFCMSILCRQWLFFSIGLPGQRLWSGNGKGITSGAKCCLNVLCKNSWWIFFSEGKWEFCVPVLKYRECRGRGKVKWETNLLLSIASVFWIYFNCRFSHSLRTVTQTAWDTLLSSHVHQLQVRTAFL